MKGVAKISGIDPFWLIIATGLCLRLIIASLLPPGYDEAYYLFYGRHLNLSYFDHPPAVGVWSWLGQQLGDGVLALRTPSVISYSVSLITLAEATKKWFGKSARLWVAIIGSACPLIFVCGGILLLPDSPLLLGISLLLLWLSRNPEFTPTGPRQAAFLSLILAFISLSKYHSFIILASLLAISLTSPSRRASWGTIWPWMTVGLWLIFSSPLWIWNYQHDWISFSFHSGRTTAGQEFSIEGSALFLLSQIGLLFPTIGFLLIGSAFSQRSHSKTEAGRLLLMLALPQLVIFVALAGRMQVMASWLVPAWWICLPLAAAWLAEQGWRSRRVRAGVVGTGCVLPPLLILATCHMRWGILNTWFPASQDPSTQLIHPDEVRKALAGKPDVWKAIQTADVIASHRYEIPGFFALALSRNNGQHFTTLGDDPRGFAFWPSLRQDRVSRGILVAPLERESSLAARAFPAPIHNVRSLGTIKVQRSGVPAMVVELASFEATPGSYPWPYGGHDILISAQPE